jgi:hypothetical protein
MDPEMFIISVTVYETNQHQNQYDIRPSLKMHSVLLVLCTEILFSTLVQISFVCLYKQFVVLLMLTRSFHNRST